MSELQQGKGCFPQRMDLCMIKHSWQSMQDPRRSFPCMPYVEEAVKAQGLTGGQLGCTTIVTVPVESPNVSLKSENTALTTNVPPAQLLRSVVLSSYVPLAALLMPSMAAHACRQQ